MVKPSPVGDIFTFRKKKNILLKSEKYQSKQKIEYVRDMKGKFVLKFSNINTINQAMKLIGYSVFGVGESEEKGSPLIDYYVKDIHQELWGKVKDIKEYGLNRVLEVENHGEIVYIPLGKGIVHEIRDDEKLIVIDPPEGLQSLNR